MKLHQKHFLLKHLKQVNAILSRIKPGFFALFFKAFTKEMVINYLEDLKTKTPQEFFLIPEQMEKKESPLPTH